MSRYHHLSPAYDGIDAQPQWFLALPDVELLEVAIYHLPPHVLKALAGTVRAVYTTPGNDEYLNAALDDSRDMYEFHMKLGNEE